MDKNYLVFERFENQQNRYFSISGYWGPMVEARKYTLNQAYNIVKRLRKDNTSPLTVYGYCQV